MNQGRDDLQPRPTQQSEITGASGTQKHATVAKAAAPEPDHHSDSESDVSQQKAPGEKTEKELRAIAKARMAKKHPHNMREVDIAGNFM